MVLWNFDFLWKTMALWTCYCTIPKTLVLYQNFGPLIYNGKDYHGTMKKNFSTIVNYC